MVDIVGNLRSIKKQYLLFIITVVLTIVVSQVIIQYDLRKQNEDARLINTAGRQRMLSQRISKLTLYINRDFEINGTTTQSKLDTLRSLTDHWEKVHNSLLKGSPEFGISDRRSKAIDSLLTAITPSVNIIVSSCKKLYLSPDTTIAQQTVAIISEHELTFLQLMEKTVATYQEEAEKKLQQLKNIELALAIASVFILFLEFLLIFLPMIRANEKSNRDLTDLNKELTSTNEELTATEEELRSNLDYVTLLQTEVEARERQYREVIEHANDMIYELDENGKFVFVNPVMETLTGLPADKLKEKGFWELIAPDFLHVALAHYKKQREEKQELSYLEFPMRNSQGELVWIGQNVRMFFRDNWVWKVSVIARDITERKKAQDALIESENKFRALAEHAPIGIFQTDASGSLVFVNKLWSEVVGISQETAKGDGWREAVHQEDRNDLAEKWKLALNGKSAFNAEFRFVNPISGIRWVHAIASKVEVEGNLTGFIGTLSDVTELRLAQKKLIESEELYRNLSENSQDVTTLVSSDDVYVYVSSAISFVLDYSPEELLGTPAGKLVHPDDYPVFDQARQAARKGFTQLHVEYRVRKKDGSYIWLDSNMQPILDQDKKITTYQTTSRNITLKKEYEAALFEAKRKAEEATKAKSQFLSMMSHEIRTPMNAIIGLTNLLMQESPRDDQGEKLKLLKFSGENLLTIINDILDFSKIEAGKIDLECVDFDLKDLLQNIIQMLQQRASEKQINLILKYDAKLGSFYKGDPVRIAQIITNIAGNAIKFTEHGYVEVRIDSGNQPHEIKFAVKDTGIGIPSEKLNLVFESFSQANSDTTRKFGGTGLGLSITKKLLDLMGSNIEVASAVGYGSTFSFVLNLEKSKDDVPKTAAKSENWTLKEGIHVLLTEDNQVNQIVATNFFKKWGVSADIANNGKEALEMIQNKYYSLVLMDLQMPEMDGYEAAWKIRQLKGDSYFQEVPIIALTASAMIDTKQKVFDSGMNDFVTKPFDPDDLRNKIAIYTQQQVPAEDKSFDHPYKADLSLYTEGDPEYRKELARLLINNIRELETALTTSLQTKNAEVYREACHKVKTTIGMVGDVEFSKVTEEIKLQLISHQTASPEFLKAKVLFEKLSRRIIKALEEEQR